MSDDEPKKGKTVIRPMPGAGGGQGGARPAARSPQKTVIGGMPPAAAPVPPPAAPASPAPGGPFGSPGFGADWTGGAQSPQAPHHDPNAWMKPKPAGQDSGGFFPTAHETAPRPVPGPSAHRKIPLDAALRATTTGASAEANQLIAAAASLLILLGRLRRQVVDMSALPLMNHVTKEIEGFESRALQAGVDNHDVQVAKYCLCGTADDIVQNIPGADRAAWLQYAMVPRFFNTRTAGVGFFQEVDKALQNPAQRYQLLEFMLTCLQLGFEGQYRGQPGGEVRLAEVRRGIYEALRRVKSRGDDDISPAWQGVEVPVRRRFGGLPVWVVAIFGAGLMAAGYFAMRYLLLDDGNRLSERMVTLHPSSQILLVTGVDVAGIKLPPPLPVVSETTVSQLERIQAALEGEPVIVEKKGDFISLRVENTVLFASGSADVKVEFGPLAEKIAAAIDGEPGPILVVGHTDNIPPSGRGRYKTNQELSVARATSVADQLTPLLTDASRVEIEGKGEYEPLNDNSTPELRAQNRRVEILLRRQDLL